MRVGDIATGRAGDKGDVLDLTLVARDTASCERLSEPLASRSGSTSINFQAYP